MGVTITRALKYIDPTYLSDTTSDPTTLGAKNGTRGAKRTSDDGWQFLEYDGSAWVALGESLPGNATVRGAVTSPALLRTLLIGDVHVGTQWASGVESGERADGYTRYYSTVRTRLASIAALHPRLDFVQVGDLCDAEVQSGKDALVAGKHISYHQHALGRAILESYGAKGVYLAGNHDSVGMAGSAVGITKEEINAWNNRASTLTPYFSEVRSGWLLVFLQCVYTTDAAGAVTGYVKGGSAPLMRLGQDQRDWLAATLDASPLPAIVFLHAPLFGMEALGDATEFRTIVEARKLGGQSAPQVRAVINGHRHHGEHRVNGGVHYVTLPGVVEFGQAGYALLEADAATGRVRVEVKHAYRASATSAIPVRPEVMEWRDSDYEGDLLTVRRTVNLGAKATSIAAASNAGETLTMQGHRILRVERFGGQGLTSTVKGRVLNPLGATVTERVDDVDRPVPPGNSQVVIKKDSAVQVIARNTGGSTATGTFAVNALLSECECFPGLDDVPSSGLEFDLQFGESAGDFTNRYVSTTAPVTTYGQLYTVTADATPGNPSAYALAAGADVTGARTKDGVLTVNAGTCVRIADASGFDRADFAFEIAFKLPSGWTPGTQVIVARHGHVPDPYDANLNGGGAAPALVTASRGWCIYVDTTGEIKLVGTGSAGRNRRTIGWVVQADKWQHAFIGVDSIGRSGLLGLWRLVVNATESAMGMRDSEIGGVGAVSATAANRYATVPSTVNGASYTGVETVPNLWLFPNGAPDGTEVFLARFHRVFPTFEWVRQRTQSFEAFLTKASLGSLQV